MPKSIERQYQDEIDDLKSELATLRASLQHQLETRFPWLLDEDEEADGGDTVDAIAEWHAEVSNA